MPIVKIIWHSYISLFLFNVDCHYCLSKSIGNVAMSYCIVKMDSHSKNFSLCSLIFHSNLCSLNFFQSMFDTNCCLAIFFTLFFLIIFPIFTMQKNIFFSHNRVMRKFLSFFSIMIVFVLAQLFVGSQANYSFKNLNHDNFDSFIFGSAKISNQQILSQNDGKDFPKNNDFQIDSDFLISQKTYCPQTHSRSFFNKENTFHISLCDESKVLIKLELSTSYNGMQFANSNHLSLSECYQKLKALNFSPRKAFEFLFPNSTAQIESIVEKLEVQKQDCKPIFKPNEKVKFQFSSFNDGITVERDMLYRSLVETLENNQTSTLIIQKDKIKCQTKEDVQKFTKLRSTFSTNYGWSGSERKHNVECASKKISGITLQPGEKFSFNTVVGNRTKQNGFEQAPIILNGKFIYGFGGGVCQVSTTLYNAVLLANLDVVEVNQHSLPVSYVKPSFDAMVSSQSDFSFVNNQDKPIYIESVFDGKSLQFNIYGQPTIQTKLVSKTVEIFEPKIETVFDETLAIGESKILQKGKRGLRSLGYIQHFKNGILIDEKKIRDNTYLSTKQIVAINNSNIDSLT